MSEANIYKIPDEVVKEKAEIVASLLKGHGFQPLLALKNGRPCPHLEQVVAYDSLLTGLSTFLAVREMLRKDFAPFDLDPPTRGALNLYACYAAAQEGLRQFQKSGLSVSGMAKLTLDYGKTQDEVVNALLALYRNGLGQLDALPDSERARSLAALTSGLFSGLIQDTLQSKDKAEYQALLSKVQELCLEVGELTLTGMQPPQEESPADLIERISFDQIVSNDYAKRVLQLLAMQQVLYDPEAQQNVLTKITRGKLPSSSAMLTSKPGAGKTMLIKAYLTYLQDLCEDAKKACHWVFFEADFKNKYVGEGVKELKQMDAKANDPSRVGAAIAEDVDGLVGARDNEDTSAADKEALTYLLNLLQGAKTKKLGNLVYISSSNREDLVDPALKGRLAQLKIPVEGPIKPEHYTTLLQNQMAFAKEHGLLAVSPKDLLQLGTTCYELKLTGRDTDNLLTRVIAQTFEQTIPPEVLLAKGKTQERLLLKLFSPITAELIKAEIERQIVINKDEEARAIEGRVNRRAEQIYIEHKAVQVAQERYNLTDPRLDALIRHIEDLEKRLKALPPSPRKKR